MIASGWRSESAAFSITQGCTTCLLEEGGRTAQNVEKRRVGDQGACRNQTIV